MCSVLSLVLLGFYLNPRGRFNFSVSCFVIFPLQLQQLAAAGAQVLYEARRGHVASDGDAKCSLHNGSLPGGLFLCT